MYTANGDIVSLKTFNVLNSPLASKKVAYFMPVQMYGHFIFRVADV
jgi:hypothetical protein